jgi:2-amino-4-hydroxy-6-hydroxymethyldihydropteridine diphosphokinase
MHRQQQPVFLNLVAEISCDQSPHQLLALCQQVERDGGRNRHTEYRYGPRPLDIDILLYRDVTLHSAVLSIPHPLMHRRPFVLDPLRELNATLRDPRTQRSWWRETEERGEQIGAVASRDTPNYTEAHHGS